jgi:hypothetical protein
MDESFKCFCGSSKFFYLINKVRCSNCYAEYEHRVQFGELKYYRRVFLKDDDNRYSHWEEVEF